MTVKERQIHNELKDERRALNKECNAKKTRRMRKLEAHLRQQNGIEMVVIANSSLLKVLGTIISGRNRDG